LNAKNMKSGAHTDDTILKTAAEENFLSPVQKTIQSSLVGMQLGKSFEVTSLGLVARDTPSKEEWLSVGLIIAKVSGVSNWWMGDWLRIGLDLKYGDLKKLAEELPYTYGTIRQFKYVADRLELSMRIDNLSWAHHQLVASLEADQRIYWLNLAAEKGWSVARLRKEIKGADAMEWLRYTDIWNFSQCDDRFGNDYPGRIPGQIVLNLLYYYTKENDLIIDPMAGGGVSLDACRYLNRRCVALDIKPNRKDIIQADTTLPWPSIEEKASLVFIDPPYWSQQKSAYQGMASSTYAEFLKSMKAVFDQSYSHLMNNGHLAVLIAPMAIKSKFTDISFDFVNTCAAFTYKRRIGVPVSSQQVGPQIVKNCKDNRIMVALLRDLLIFQK